MARRNLNDLLAFVTIAREGSFTRAAATLGVTQSALSQTIRAMEESLQIRLLSRTTRSVSPTPAGERLLQAIGHRLDEIDAELDALTELREKPAGTVRITCGDYMLHSILLPNGPALRMAVVGSPAYFANRPIPKKPQDLMHHNCINQRMPTSGGLYVWDFERRGQKLNVRVDGQLIFNTTQPQVDAALGGLGLTLLPEDELMPHIVSGRLVRVLEDWCPRFDGYHLYYPSRRQPSPAFSMVLDALRIRG